MPEDKTADWSPLFEAHFSGPDVVPGRVRSKDLGEVITAIEDLIAIMISENHLGIVRKDAIVVGLKNIKSGSTSLAFDVNDRTLSMEAISELRQRFKKNELIKLPLAARRSLDTILKFVKKYNSPFKARSLEDPSVDFFSLDLDTEIPYSPSISGETVLYGQVAKAGGTESPKIQFKLLTGQTVYCETTKEIAVKAAQKLYQEVGLRGLASWNTETSFVEEFYVKEILDYEKTDISEGFDYLRSNFSDAFGDVGNIDEFIAGLRES